MYKFLFLILTFNIYLVFGSLTCQLEDQMISSQESQHGQDNDLYFYIPMNAIGTFQNSICIYNGKAEILDCLNMVDFKEQQKLSWNQPSFTTIKHITHNLYAISYVSDEIFFSVYLNNAHWIIIDDFFNIK